MQYVSVLANKALIFGWVGIASDRTTAPAPINQLIGKVCNPAVESLPSDVFRRNTNM